VREGGRSSLPTPTDMRARGCLHGVSATLKRLAKRAGINKRVFTHMGRHQSITQIGRAGLSMALNARRAGITTRTLEATYLHHVDADVDSEILRIKGIKDDPVEDLPQLKARICGRCKRTCAATDVLCQCGAYLDSGAAAQAEEKREKMDRLLIDELVKERVAELASRLVDSGEAEVVLKRVFSATDRAGDGA
jgi:hypothetical protein